MPTPRGALQRVLGVGFGLAIIVGGAVGVGILRTPGTIAGLVQHEVLVFLAWGLAGLYALLQANNLAELAAAIPRSGGSYVFARRALGPYGGFLIGWSDWLALTVATAYIPLAAAEYGARLVPSLAGFEPVVAVAGLAVFASLQLAGVRAGSRTQEVVSLAKAAALLAFVAACLLAPAAPGSLPHAGSPPRDIATGGVTLVAFAGALQLVIGAYGGWYAAAFFGEEQVDPGRDVPRALLLGVLVVMAIYLLMNAAYLHVLPIRALAASTLPAATAMQRVFGGASDRLVTGLALLVLLGILNALVMIAPRALFAIARDGLFFRRAASVNRRGTPAVATILTALVAVALALSGTFERLFALTAVLMTVVDAVNTLNVLVLRRREPGLARPYRAWGAPLTTVIALLASLALLVGFVAADRRTALVAVIFMALSYPVYRQVARHSAVARHA
ncbi:MAG TPA: APC family permease [Gemmatimonadaceae bacterium]|nr:APC family permease [Gemmatimonadaceae bacterium]